MVRLGIYKHSKSGREYRALFIPASMWEEEVEIEGKKVPRFVFVRD